MCLIAVHWWRIDYVEYYVKHIQFPAMLIYVSIVTVLLTLAAFIHKKDREAPAHADQNNTQEGPATG
ncbi:hypothetical protein D3C76_1355190 [compost metagenome]